MSNKIQVRRGNAVNIPNPLDNGEFGWCADTKELYIGNGIIDENVKLNSIQSASYLIYKQGNNIFAQNGDNNVIEYSSTNFVTVFNSVMLAISPGATVVIKDGLYTPTSAINVTKSVIIRAEGNVVFNWNILEQELFTFSGTALSNPVNGITTIKSDVNTDYVKIANVFQDDGGVFTDYTVKCGNNQPKDVLLLPSTVVINDAFYFGHTLPFGDLKLNMGTAGSGYTIVWEYYNGTIWTPIPGIVDDTSGFTMSGTNNVTFAIPNNWRLATAGGIKRFWIRSRVTSISSPIQPKLTQGWVYSKSIGTDTIVVNAKGDAVAGDLVYIYDNTAWNPTESLTWKTGELHEILSISGDDAVGYTITVTDSIINSYTKAQNGTVMLIRPITVEIEGIQINGALATGEYAGIRLFYNKNSVIRRSKLTELGFRAIEVLDSFNTLIEDDVIGNCILAGYGYGVVTDDSSAFTTIHNNRFFNCRHATASGGYGIKGQSRETMVTGNTFANGTFQSHVLDSHPQTQSLYIYNNIIYCHVNDYAIRSAARITQFVGNTVIGGHGCSSRGSDSMSCLIADNQFINVKQCYWYDVTLLTPNHIGIHDNVITGNYAQSIAKINSWESFSIKGNTLICDNPNINDGTSGVYITNGAKNGTVSDNIFKNIYQNGIYAQLDCTNIMISDNMFVDCDVSGAGNYCIALRDSSYCTISGNMCKSAKGIGIFSTGAGDCNNIMIHDNDLRQTITPIYQQPNATNITKYKNAGYATENDVLSGTFPISSIGIKTVTIPHGLAIVPNVQDCYLAVVQDTAVDDWAYNLLKVVATSATGVTVKINVSAASVTVGATAKLGLRVGNP